MMAGMIVGAAGIFAPSALLGCMIIAEFIRAMKGR